MRDQAWWWLAWQLQFQLLDQQLGVESRLCVARQNQRWLILLVTRLKDNLPELLAADRQRFPCGPPTRVFQHGADRVEVWDAEDFDPWNTLRWETVRVFFYRQHKPDGKVVEAYWLTNFPSSTVDPQALFRMAKSRWEIENQGFNDAKSRHGLEHICHHHANSLLIDWLLAMMALTKLIFPIFESISHSLMKRVTLPTPISPSPQIFLRSRDSKAIDCGIVRRAIAVTAQIRTSGQE